MQERKSQGSAFRNMLIWQRGRELARATYLFSSRLPKDEQFGLINQMRRCAVSIPSNIAEGSKRGTKKDFIQFLRIANGSAAELETQLVIVGDVYKMKVPVELEGLVEEVQRMIQGLIKKLQL